MLFKLDYSLNKSEDYLSKKINKHHRNKFCLFLIIFFIIIAKNTNSRVRPCLLKYHTPLLVVLVLFINILNLKNIFLEYLAISDKRNDKKNIIKKEGIVKNYQPIFLCTYKKY